MLYIILFYLMLYTFGAFILLDKDIFSPSVVTGLMLILGTSVACIGNVNWKVTIPVQVLIIYMIGTIFMLIGEIFAKRLCCKGSFRLNYTKNYRITEVKIPIWIILSALVFSIVVALLSEKKAVQIAYANGYYSAEWQSMPVYVKHALSSGRASFGMVLSTCRQVVENCTYLGLFFFIMNGTVMGFGYALRKHFLLCSFIFPYAYIMSLQGQRSSFIAIIAFCFYSFWILYSHLRIEVNHRKLIIAGGFFICLFLLYFTVIGSLTGRSANSNAFENIFVYIGSSIVDFAEYLNSDAGKYTFTWGTRTFSGFYATATRLIPFFTPVKPASDSFDFGFVFFENGSSSNVYGPYAKFFSEFSYIGVAILPLLQGAIYRLMYNNARRNSVSVWGIYLFSFISYGIVIAFVDEQQFQLLFSVYQLMHLMIAYILLNLCLTRCSGISNRIFLENKSFIYKLIGQNKKI